MKLVRLSVISIIGCAAGLLALVAMALQSFDRMRVKQAELAGLIQLERRIDSFSVASDSLLLFGADPSLWRLYHEDADDIRERLESLGDENPSARNASRIVGMIVEAVRKGVEEPPSSDGGTLHGSYGPLSLTLRGRIIMNRVAGHGIALDTAYDEVLGARQQAIAREAAWTAGAFAGAALLFGALCVAAFGLIHRRIAGPTRELSGAIQRVRSGDREARARISGSDELADLASEFNRMVDHQQVSEQRLNHFAELIESSNDLCAICDAEYRYVLVNRAYAEWFGKDHSQIEGRPAPEVLGQEYFRDTVKPHLDRALAGEVQVFESIREHVHMGKRNLWLRYFPIRSGDGEVRYGGAVIADLTELKRAEAKLDEQSRLLDIAGRTARVGGWSVDLEESRVRWSDTVAAIHGKPPGYSPTVKEGIEFYAPEWRDRITELFQSCAERGEPYDEELQIIDARGERAWVRAVGEPVYDDRGRIVRVQGAFQDISARKQAEEERIRLAERNRAILESITDAFFTLDSDWRFGYINRAAEELLERPRGELAGRNIWEEFPEAAGTRFQQEYERARSQQVTVTLEEYYLPLGKWFDIRAYPMDDGLAVCFRDSTERRRILDQLREQEEHLRSSHDELSRALSTRQALINSLPAHIALLDTEGNILDVNEQWRHFGMENDATDQQFGVGVNYIVVCESAEGDCSEGALEAAAGLRGVLSGREETFTLEYPCHSPNRLRWFRVMANRLQSAADSGETYGAVVMHVDITERKLAEQELNRLAYQDPLTGLPSRNGFVHKVRESVHERGWEPDALVVSLNVRGLHDINEAHGFFAGDRLLIQIGERLNRCFDEGAVVGRTGGDDFVVFLPEAVLHQGPTDQVLARLETVFSEPFDVIQASVESSACYGYTRLGKRLRDVEELLREAALALSHSRHDYYGPSWTAYTEELAERAQERVRINRELHRALENQEFELHFQPKVVLATGELISCEALLRWRHPELGLQAPGSFVAIAEQSQLIAPIGDWVVNEACRRLKGWQEEGLDIVRVSVNVSLVQFFVGDLTQTIAKALASYGVPPSSLSLEITESVFERQSETLLAQMNELHELGVHLSLDDFGTGYSSLLYLQRYPFDEIKIDQGFVHQVQGDEYSRHIVSTVVRVAGAIGADVVAEGVESEEVRDTLLQLGCRLGQGFYYSVPLEAEDFRWLLKKGSMLPLRKSAK